MPYSKKNPPTFSKNMPAGAQAIAIETANAVLSDSGSEEDAIRAAIANVKNKYKKVGDQWIPKAALVDVSMIITKASLQDDGTMHWMATASDTGMDRMGESTSLSLFRDWIKRTVTGKSASFLPPPRVPFLGLSHYPSMDGLGEAGPTERMYIDGSVFRAGGTFYSDDLHPLGAALFKAVRQEYQLIKRGETVENPIRISAAWWDLCHSHGNFVFERKSLDDICPMCQDGAAGKIYLEGQLDHFAATRVPIHPRTSLALEEKAMTTRKQDAASIIDPELAEELDEKAKLVGKSETEDLPGGMVVKADDKQPDTEKAVTKTVGGKPYPASDFLVVADPQSPNTWNLQVKRNGKLDHTLMGAAWAALHEGYRGNKYKGPEKQAAIGKLTKLYASEKLETPTATKAAVEKNGMGMAYPEMDEIEEMPLDGAMTLTDAEAYLQAQGTMAELRSNWGLFTAVMGNILEAAEPGDIKEKVKSLVDEFGSRVDAIKAAVEDAVLIEVSGGLIMSEKTNVEQVVVNSADSLKAAVDAALANKELDRKSKFEAIQVALEGYAQAVKAEVDAVAPQDPGEAVQKALLPVVEKLELIIQKLGHPATPTQVPQQKSLAPSGPVQPIQSQQPPTLRDMIRRSVGIVQ